MQSQVHWTQLMVELLLEDKKQLPVPTRTVFSSRLEYWVCFASSFSYPDDSPPPPLQIANVAPLGFCCVFDYIHLFPSAGLEECFGFTPCHQLLSQARRNIKAASKEKATVGVVVVVGGGFRGGGAARVMSRWTERRAGEPVTWLMADLPLHWRGEASQARPLPLPLPLPSSHDTHTHFIDTYPFLLAASAVVCAGANIRNFLQSGLHP